MEVEKRKRLEDRELIDHRKKKVMINDGSKIEEADDDEKKAAHANAVVRDHEGDDDGEVEEFFEILKRIRVAVKYFEKGDGGGDGKRRPRETMARPKAWNPSFEREDFEGFKVEKGSEVSVEQNAVLDLNAVPIDT